MTPILLDRTYAHIEAANQQPELTLDSIYFLQSVAARRVHISDVYTTHDVWIFQSVIAHGLFMCILSLSLACGRFWTSCVIYDMSASKSLNAKEQKSLVSNFRFYEFCYLWEKDDTDLRLCFYLTSNFLIIPQRPRARIISEAIQVHIAQ